MHSMPTVTLCGVSAAQFGGQADAGEGWLPLETDREGLTRVPSKSAFR